MNRFGNVWLRGILVLVANVGATLNTQASWVVGNGGDSLRLNMTKAKEHASLMVTKITKASLREADPDVRKFLLENRQALAGDIMLSPHVWTLEEHPTCAWTTQPSGDKPEARPIDFSYPTCRKSIDSYRDAALLLIHESAHHFFKGEDFADRLALTVVNVWESGVLEWQNVTKEDAPSPRFQHSAVYTKNKMIVYGGIFEDTALNSGGIYDIEKDSWKPINTQGAPVRYNHHAFVYKNKMVIWGGYSVEEDGGVLWHHNGALYDLETERWQIVSAPYDSPVEYYLDYTQAQSATLVDGKLYVWGGMNRAGSPIGGIYSLESGQWQSFPSMNAPSRLGGHTAVAVDGGILVWGGFEGPDVFNRELTNKGAFFDFSEKKWQTMSSHNAPSARSGHVAVSTGSKMVVFSGDPERRGRGNTLLHATGGIYDVATRSWKSFTTQIATERTGHRAIWNGNEVLISGGKSRYLRSYYSDVIAFNPDAESWRAVSGKMAPSIRHQHSAIWAGSSMIIWGGGIGADSPKNSGSRFFP